MKLGLSYRNAYLFANTRKGYWRTAHSKTLNLFSNESKTGVPWTNKYVQDALVNLK